MPKFKDIKSPKERKRIAALADALCSAELAKARAQIDVMKIGALHDLACDAYAAGPATGPDASSWRSAAEGRARNEIREWIRVNRQDAGTHPDEHDILTTIPAHVTLAPAQISEVTCGACGGNDALDENPCAECRGLGRLTNPALVEAQASGLPVWSGPTIPPVGATVRVTINSIGESTVLGYFVEHGFMGLYVQPRNVPAWYSKQNGHAPAHVFGAEIEAVSL